VRRGGPEEETKSFRDYERDVMDINEEFLGALCWLN